MTNKKLWEDPIYREKMLQSRKNLNKDNIINFKQAIQKLELTYWERVKLLMISGHKVQVVLQRRVRLNDLRGGSQDTWIDTEEFKAVLSPIKLNIEGLKYNKEFVDGDHVLYSKAISSTITNFDRITYEGRVFDIKAVQTPLMSTKVFKLVLKEIR